MSSFEFTELEEGEEVLFGISKSSSSQSSSFSVGGKQVSGSSNSSERTMGITNQRVIVESLSAPVPLQSIPNEEVRKVVVKSDTFMGKPGLMLISVETKDGEVVPLGLRVSDADGEARLREVFPNAEIAQEATEPPKKKGGLLGWLGFGD